MATNVKYYVNPEDHAAVEQWTRDALLDLAWDYPLFGMGAAKVINRITIEPRIQTAGITQWGRLYINPEFAASCSRGQLAWVMAHEICHPLLGHFNRQQGRLPELWNVATDMAINCNLQDGFADAQWVQTPHDPLLPKPEHWGWAAERIYDALLQEHMQQQQQGQGQGQGGGMQDPNQDRFQQAPKVGQGCGMLPDDGADGGGSQAGDDEQDGQDQDQAGAGQDQDPTAELDAQDAEEAGKSPAEVEREWRDMAIQSAHMQRTQGRGKGAALCRIADVPEPKVPWKKVLRKGLAMALAAAGADHKTWSRRGRRSQIVGDFFLPGWAGSRAKIAVVIDTSGSMSDDALKQCVAETQAAARESGVPLYLVTHDDGVQWEGWLRPTVKLDGISAAIKGRGGTSAHEAYERVGLPLHPRERPNDGRKRKGGARKRCNFDAMIHLTDCELMWPAWPPNCRNKIIAHVTDSDYTVHVPEGATVFDVDITGTYG